MEQQSNGHFSATKEDARSYFKSLDIYEDDSDSVRRINIGYARVSSTDQKKNGDLDRQVSKLVDALQKETLPYIIIKDTGSGLNTKRRGLIQLMDEVQKGSVDKIFVTYKDRLTRFGYEYLETFFSYFKTQIVPISVKEEKNAQEELLEDMFSLIASFSGKLYGMRGRKKDIEKKAEQILEENLN